MSGGAERIERVTGQVVRELRAAGSQHRWAHYRAVLADGRAAFAKVARAGLGGVFEAEARGLRWLGEAGARQLRERGLAVGQHGPVVHPAVLRPGGPQFPHGLAGEPLDPLSGPGHVRGCAVSPSSSASWLASPRAPACTRSSASA